MSQPEFYTLSIFADYYHFLLLDENAEDDFSDNWDAQAIANMFAVGSGIIGIGTARNTRVPVRIELLETSPNQEDLTQWDHVVEASIDVPSGTLVVIGPSDYFPDAQRVLVKTGTYRIRIFYRRLESIRHDGLDGDDHYHIILWRDVFKPSVILKQKQHS